MAVDAEKAFDRLEWPFLFKVLEKFYLTAEIIDFIKLVYKYPTARTYTNDLLSGEVTLERSTRQGCPLSPLLFALAMEPFVEKIRQDPEVTGVSIGKQQNKLNFFADDLLMYLTNFEKSIPFLFKIISEYSLVSGYKINMDKTEVMAVGKHKNISQESFKWTNSIKYLGCIISHNKQQI